MRALEPQEEKLSRYMSEAQIKAEHLIFETSCHTAEEAARSAGAQLEDLVKNVCIMGDSGAFLVAIVKGEDKVDYKQVALVGGVKKPKHAPAELVLEKTGYAVGGVPSFGYDAQIVIDQRVMEKDWVLTGGGSDKSLVRIAPAELLRVSGGVVAHIRK